MTQQEFQDKLKALLDEAGVDLQPMIIIQAVPRLQPNPPYVAPQSSAQSVELAPVDPAIIKPVEEGKVGSDTPAVSEPSAQPSEDSGVPVASEAAAGGGEAVAQGDGSAV